MKDNAIGMGDLSICNEYDRLKEKHDTAQEEFDKLREKSGSQESPELKKAAEKEIKARDELKQYEEDHQEVLSAQRLK